MVGGLKFIKVGGRAIEIQSCSSSELFVSILPLPFKINSNKMHFTTEEDRDVAFSILAWFRQDDEKQWALNFICKPKKRVLKH